MPTPSLVLFDLDETLFDHRHASRTALACMRERHPSLAAVPFEHLQNRAHDILDQTHRALLGKRLSMDEARLERIRMLFEVCGAAHSEEFLDRAATEYGTIYRRARRAFPGAIDLLRQLRRHDSVRQVGIVTNHMAQTQREKLAACGLVDLVDFMVTSQEVGHLKPAPQIFQAALDHAGVSPEDAVMVGDSWESDIRGAESAGIRAVWFNPGGNPPPDGGRPQAGAGAPGSTLRSFQPAEACCRVILSECGSPE